MTWRKCLPILSIITNLNSSFRSWSGLGSLKGKRSIRNFLNNLRLPDYISVCVHQL